MGLGSHLLNHVELAIAGQAKVLHGGLLEVLQVVVVQRPGVHAGVVCAPRSAVIGQAASLAKPLLAIGIGVGPDRIDGPLLL